MVDICKLRVRTKQRILTVMLMFVFVVCIINVNNGFTPVEVASADSNQINLNNLMKETFDQWYSWILHYYDTDAVVHEYYEISTGPHGGRTWSAVGYSIYALISMYEATGDQKYLMVVKFFVDRAIENTTFFRYDSSAGTVFYAPQFWYDGSEHDFTPKLTMMYGYAAVKLYLWLGNQKYADLAHRIAQESLKFLLINNETDMAWSPSYCGKGWETADPKVGVNRQTSIAAFYAIYGSTFNQTYLTYIPKILHWVWRAKLSNGGLAYDIGGSTVSDAYTAFSIWHALLAYKYANNYFDSSLKNNITESLDYLLTVSHKPHEDTVSAAAMALAWKLNFNNWANTTNIQYVKNLLYFTLQNLKISLYKNGLSTLAGRYGFRWQEYFSGCF